jgi:hypothetical protein
MAKEATVKDVLYALEHLRERLVLDNGKWQLQPSGTRVKPHVADEARTKGPITSTAISGEVSYLWST